MHCETLTHHVRYTFGERESMEILSGETLGPLKSFTPSCHLVALLSRLCAETDFSLLGGASEQVRRVVQL